MSGVHPTLPHVDQQNMRNVTVFKGDDANLTCLVQSDFIAPVTVMWWRFIPSYNYYRRLSPVSFINHVSSRNH